VFLELREELPDKTLKGFAAYLMKKICLGSCIARNDYRSKNLRAPFWYCEETRETGVFPEGRKKGAEKGSCP
jgi:hypothetical protein